MDKIEPILISPIFGERDLFKAYDITFSVPVYWYTELIDDDIFDYIDSEAFINDIKNNNGILVFDHSMDPMRQYMLTKNDNWISIFNFFNTHDLPLDQVIVVSPLPPEDFFKSTPQLYVSNFRSLSYKRVTNYVQWNSLWFLYRYQHKRIIRRSFDSSSHHFLCLSRRDSISRRFTNYLLHKNKVFSKGLVSHLRIEENGMVKDTFDHKTEFDMLRSRDCFDPLAFIRYGYLRHELDGPQEDKKLATSVYSRYDRLIDKCCFDLVVETDPMTNFFVTEKTFKPLISGTPFLIIGPPYHLMYLKKLGFKTYSDIFDESYDEIPIYYDRVNAVFKNVKRLCDMSLKDCKKLMKSVAHIAEHNQNVFFSISWTFNFKKRIQNKIDEILSNRA